MSRKAPRILAFLSAGAWLLAHAAAAQPIGAIDYPTDGQTVSGIVRVSGFVLDERAVDSIQLIVDGTIVNRAEMNLPRPDVLEIFPTYYNSETPNPGFLTSFLANNYDDGPHSVSILVTEAATQESTIVATVDVVVDNSVNQAPFGYIDTPGPAGLEGANGAFPVTGWAIDDVDVDHIDFLFDGGIVAGAVGRGEPGTAIYGSTRPDVAAAFPDVPNSLYTGFSANIDTTQFINGIHILSVRVWDNEGASRVIGTRRVQVVNAGQNLAPFGNIDFPLDKASLFCSKVSDVLPSPCTPDICNQVLTNIVKGWALDVGSRLDAGQVSYVELLLDGQIVANSRTDCVQIGQALTNCYGVNRPDVARSYPGFVNADNAGFLFSFALISTPADGNLIEIWLPSPGAPGGLFGPVGYTTAGKHTIAIRAGDEEETVSQIEAMSVDILCDQSTGDQPAFGYIDAPSDYQFVDGLFLVLGWATDFQGVNRVEVDVDGQVVGIANYPISRPDVPANDPRVALASVGFSYVLDTTQLPNSPHDLVIYVVDHQNNRSEIGRRKFVVNNNVTTNQ
jgi:hypothetical protein